jgi:hypothetical protein
MSGDAPKTLTLLNPEMKSFMVMQLTAIISDSVKKLPDGTSRKATGASSLLH